MKRKNMDYAAVKAATASSDFSTRYSENYGKALADHRFASEFELNNLRAYADDTEGTTYEIRTVDDTTYLVFIMTVIKVSLAMDEANLYDEMDVSLQLMPDSLDSFSQVNSFAASLGLTILIIAAFITVVYMFILPKHIRDAMIGRK